MGLQELFHCSELGLLCVVPSKGAGREQNFLLELSWDAEAQQCPPRDAPGKGRFQLTSASVRGPQMDVGTSAARVLGNARLAARSLAHRQGAAEVSSPSSLSC